MEPYTSKPYYIRSGHNHPGNDKSILHQFHPFLQIQQQQMHSDILNIQEYWRNTIILSSRVSISIDGNVIFVHSQRTFILTWQESTVLFVQQKKNNNRDEKCSVYSEISTLLCSFFCFYIFLSNLGKNVN